MPILQEQKSVTQSSGKKYIHVSTLHVSTILPAYLKQRIGKQPTEHVLVQRPSLVRALPETRVIG